MVIWEISLLYEFTVDLCDVWILGNIIEAAFFIFLSIYQCQIVAYCSALDLSNLNSHLVLLGSSVGAVFTHMR